MAEFNLILRSLSFLSLSLSLFLSLSNKREWTFTFSRCFTDNKYPWYNAHIVVITRVIGSRSTFQHIYRQCADNNISLRRVPTTEGNGVVLAVREEKFPHKSAILRPLSVQGCTHLVCLWTPSIARGAFMSDEIYRCQKDSWQSNPSKFLKFVSSQNNCFLMQYIHKIAKLKIFHQFKFNKFFMKIIVKKKYWDILSIKKF